MMGFLGLFRKRPIRIIEPDPSPTFLFGACCFEAMQLSLQESLTDQHEGVCFILGRLVGIDAVGLHCVRPRARTSPGSFFVPAIEMAKVVEIACDLGLQVVAQVHTHPESAFHSDGDEDGARIRYPGFLSLVVPDYGAKLPSLEGAALYRALPDGGWDQLPASAIRVLSPGTFL